jgi:hypothetical protein
MGRLMRGGRGSEMLRCSVRCIYMAFSPGLIVDGGRWGCPGYQESTIRWIYLIDSTSTARTLRACISEQVQCITTMNEDGEPPAATSFHRVHRQPPTHHAPPPTPNGQNSL